MPARSLSVSVTVLVAAPDDTASRVADILSDREVRGTSRVADARNALDDDPAAVLVASELPDGPGTDLLAAVRSGERCRSNTPVLALRDVDDADLASSDDLDETDDTEGSDDLPEADDAAGFDDRVSVADRDALGASVHLAVAVGEYRAATAELYDLSRRRSDGKSIDPADLDDARDAANDRLTDVQRAANGRTPFHRLLSQ